MAKTSRKQELRDHLEVDLVDFAKYINPHYCYGEIHEEVFRWLMDEENDHQLLLMPRGHLKSHCIAVWAVWQITRDPTTTMVYLSAGEDLATLQVAAIKGMFLSDRYQALWPEMINEREGDREKWSAWAINVDHPLRKAHGIRDNTIIVKTVKSNAIGLHCSHLVLDDVVVDKNAYTETGRNEVRQAVSQFASIKNPGAFTKAVGTRYHPRDLYHDFHEAQEPLWDDETGEPIGEKPLWDIKEYVTEDSGDGMGEFLWPRTLSEVTGKWYGFDRKVLGKIKAQYFSVGQQAQYYAQYYNDPNDPGSETVSRSNFQYYNPKHLLEEAGNWYYKDNRLVLTAAMDVAWSDNNKAGKRDYTAIVVIGIDADGMIYLLDMERFQTDEFHVYYEHVLDLYRKWGFRKIHVETNAAGHFIEKELKNYVRANGDALVVEGKAATRHQGKKEEKHAMITYPRYEMKSVWHRKGGLTNILEEEITLKRPPHDDLLDALTTCIANSKPPSQRAYRNNRSNVVPMVANNRFGGRRR